MSNKDIFHNGQYNTLQQEWQSDGSVKMTMVDVNKNKTYKIRLKHILEPTESEVDYDTGQPINEGSLEETLPEV